MIAYLCYFLPQVNNYNSPVFHHVDFFTPISWGVKFPVISIRRQTCCEYYIDCRWLMYGVIKAEHNNRVMCWTTSSLDACVYWMDQITSTSVVGLEACIAYISHLHYIAHKHIYAQNIQKSNDSCKSICDFILTTLLGVILKCRPRYCPNKRHSCTTYAFMDDYTEVI